MVHSANWDPELTMEKIKGKKVALIGAGSSGIQILPQIQPHAEVVDHYMASQTWISPIGFGSQELTDRGAIGNCKFVDDSALQLLTQDHSQTFARRAGFLPTRPRSLCQVQVQG